MRAERLVTTLLLLQRHGRVTAGQLAEHTGVSVPTARRDLESLSSAGVPVYAQPGRGGGWELVGGARTDLSGLAEAEVQAIFLLVGAAGDGPHPPALLSALRKLVRAIPAPFRETADIASSALLIDDSGWGAEAREPAPIHADTVRTAIVKRRCLEVSYLDSAGRQSERLIEPWGLVLKDGTRYVVAGTTRGHRLLRLDRITAAQLSAQPAGPPPTDLPSLWAEAVTTVEARRSMVSATVLVERRALAATRRHFGRHLLVVEDREPGEPSSIPGHEPPTEAIVTAHTVLALAEQLAGWGSVLTVTGPPAVQDELARIGRALVESYGSTASPGED
ncbi:MAG: WYL domain-containing protein [Propionibacteriaceae bacterium]|nr:WYL domain-containing protein [Micropruina sp.]HBY24220.1 WYL domain-containing protein [Propionibacteriaceae bacterium]